MGDFAARSECVLGSAGGCDPSLSLSVCLQVVARHGGCEINFDDLNAALGASWMVSAIRDEDDLACWAMYARDTFLIEAGRLFGLTIRAIHPPEAARGLSGLPEFGQHFDASYRPLILRALEHEQPILAWQGWAGHPRMMWGIITNACRGGIGLSGRVPETGETPPSVPEGRTDVPVPSSARAFRQYVTLDRPPVQLYVVEAITPAEPQPHELLDIALKRAQTVLGNGLDDRLGVVTGPAAYDMWLDRMRDVDGNGPPARELLAGHRRLAASVAAAHESAIRFLNRQRARLSGGFRSRLDLMKDSSEAVVTSLNPQRDAASAGAPSSGHLGPATPIDAIGSARDATKRILDAVKTTRAPSP